MKNLILTIIMSVFVLATFADCKRRPSAKAEATVKATAESFTLTYEEGLDTCIAILVKNMGLDSVTARKRCICMYDSYVQIDSAFPRMNPDDRQEFMMAHRDEVIAKCDSLFPAEAAKPKE